MELVGFIDDLWQGFEYEVSDLWTIDIGNDGRVDVLWHEDARGYFSREWLR